MGVIPATLLLKIVAVTSEKVTFTTLDSNVAGNTDTFLKLYNDFEIIST